MDESRIQVAGRARKVQYPIFRTFLNVTSLYVDTWQDMRWICSAMREASCKAQGAGAICSDNPSMY